MILAYKNAAKVENVIIIRVVNNNIDAFLARSFCGLIYFFWSCAPADFCVLQNGWFTYFCRNLLYFCKVPLNRNSFKLSSIIKPYEFNFPVLGLPWDILLTNYPHSHAVGPWIELSGDSSRLETGVVLHLADLSYFFLKLNKIHNQVTMGSGSAKNKIYCCAKIEGLCKTTNLTVKFGFFSSEKKSSLYKITPPNVF